MENVTAGDGVLQRCGLAFTRLRLYRTAPPAAPAQLMTEALSDAM
ncbi:MAG: hypothetical protein ACOYD3_07495 [Kiritimatiellia bacterium]